jgi:hypothetical protein
LISLIYYQFVSETQQNHESLFVQGMPSIGIPFLDREPDMDPAQYGALAEYLWYETKKPKLGWIESYYAGYSFPRASSMYRESKDIGGFGEARNVELFLPGIASLLNHHAVLNNGG